MSCPYFGGVLISRPTGFSVFSCLRGEMVFGTFITGATENTENAL